MSNTPSADKNGSKSHLICDDMSENIITSFHVFGQAIKNCQFIAFPAKSFLKTFQFLKLRSIQGQNGP